MCNSGSTHTPLCFHSIHPTGFQLAIVRMKVAVLHRQRVSRCFGFTVLQRLCSFCPFPSRLIHHRTNGTCSPVFRQHQLSYKMDSRCTFPVLRTPEVSFVSPPSLVEYLDIFTTFAVGMSSMYIYALHPKNASL